jgi:hypothetical protein
MEELKSVLVDEKISYYVLSRKEDIKTLGSAKAVIMMLIDTS